MLTLTAGVDVLGGRTEGVWLYIGTVSLRLPGETGSSTVGEAGGEEKGIHQDTEGQTAVVADGAWERARGS
jgi:hypothetical protein